MCWTTLPIMCSYLDNGYFTILEKLKYAIKYNIYYYVVVAVFAVFFLISLLIAQLKPLK